MVFLLNLLGKVCQVEHRGKWVPFLKMTFVIHTLIVSQVFPTFPEEQSYRLQTSRNVWSWEARAEGISCL